MVNALQNRSFVQPGPGGDPPPLQFPPFPHKQRVTQARPGAVQGAERGEADPLTARTGPYNLALRKKGGGEGRVAAAEPPSIRALDSEILLFLFPQGQPSCYLS